MIEWFGDTVYARLIINLAMFLLTTLIFWLVYRLIFRIFSRLSQRVLKEDSKVQPLKIQRQEILSSEEVANILNRSLLIISWFLRAVIVLLWLNTILGLFSWTREIANSIAAYLQDQLHELSAAVIDYIPDLITAVIIILLGYSLIRLCRLVFKGVERRRITVPGFYPEWSRTSFNLIRMLIIAMTVVVVFPYLPGSGSPAFQGVSIFFGVLLSLGSTSAVANVISGIVLTYTRAFRKGDFVSISQTEGRVIERTAFVTRIRTNKNVDVSIPNATVMADKVINYSSQAKHTGITLHTGVTIGYDVPWPKVQELLLAAASATGHIEADPAPFVLQTALDDNYVAYELNASTKRADLRPQIYSALHANILDAFHTAGVEITSPHYRAVRDGNEAAMAPVIPQPS
jgi:small-conductance mechanosensitive channel